MLRVTGPVTRSRSAWRGEATKWMPNRSLSYTGPVSPLISISQPLQEPASTSRMARARPKSRRDSASTSRTRWTTSSSPGASGPIGTETSPTLSIFANSSISRLLWGPGPAGPRNQTAGRGVRRRVGDDRVGELGGAERAAEIAGLAALGESVIVAVLDPLCGGRARRIVARLGQVV